MAIGNAVQKGGYVHNEKGRQSRKYSAGTGKVDGLTGYTGSNVNIRRGSLMYTYAANGRQLSTSVVR